MVSFLEGVEKYFEKGSEDRKNIVFVVGDGRLNKELVKNKLL